MLILSAPVHYTLELTPCCNNRCIGCGNVIDKQIKPLGASGWRSILNKIHSHAVHVRISGGEPTLHPEFEFIVNVIANLNMSFTVFTNARWKKPDHLICFLSEIPKCKGLLVSLHGHNPELHESFTGIKGSFYETVRNIQKAVESGIKVAISTIITNFNFNYTNEIIQLSEELGACQTTFSRYVAVKNEIPAPNIDQLQKAISAIENKRKNGAHVEYSVCIPQCFMRSSSTGCLSGVTYCVIDPQGNVRPCTHVPIRCGNLLEKPIEEIWHSSEMQAWRDIIPAECQDCLEFSECRGGCRAMAVLSRLGKDPLMSRPITEKPDEPIEKFVFYEGLCPIGEFILRSEPFGYILLRENRVVPVSFEAKPILDTLDGTITLKQIKESFGEHGLDFIAHLYHEGLVDFRHQQF